MNFRIKFNTSSEFFHEIRELNRQRSRQGLGLIVGPSRLPLPRPAARFATAVAILVAAIDAVDNDAVIVVRIRLRVPSAAAATTSAGGFLFAAGTILVGGAGAAVGVVGQPIFGEQGFVGGKRGIMIVVEVILGKIVARVLIWD